ncbi:unnamed protein product [Echinostoma caproni]|uniref:Peptidase_C39_2 domain-containing protein n=1 Tax=Echinostoma caproni TaxID=27848 RepID=A0A183A8G0_9TREM|nr:unnamed protein product [Echinostoma caproni]
MAEIPLWVLIKEQEKNWRGTLLAVFTIGLISGLIIIAALFVTYHSFVYANPNGSWSRLDLPRGTSVRTFADALQLARPMNLDLADIPQITGLWPNSKQTAWLIQFDEKRIGLQDSGFHYLVVLADNTRISVNPKGSDNQSALVHCAAWNAKEYSLVGALHPEISPYFNSPHLFPQITPGLS